MFKKVLIANRGEIAVRIIRTCRELGIATVAVHSQADSDSLHVLMADKAVCIGGAATKDSYLNMHNIMSAAIAAGADAIHPGYGFLSENDVFAELCSKYGITYIGPPAECLRLMGNKSEARRTAAAAGVPVITGSDMPADTIEQASSQAQSIGYPVMVKAVSGGGGRGIRIVNDASELCEAFPIAKAEAKACFGDEAVYIEKYLSHVRHIEFQILADNYGECIHLGERDCSLQQRNQKIIEEAPCHALTCKQRQDMGDAAINIAQAVGYRNAGTVEFLFDGTDFYFMEMNTRIQVEHPITEMITGVDLIKQQLSIASGEALSFLQHDVIVRGHSIECRINAQHLHKTSGKVNAMLTPGGYGVRVDTHLYEGYKIPPFYDSMLAKLIVYAEDRPSAIARMRVALEDFTIEGIETNSEFLEQIINNDLFKQGATDTRFIDSI